MTPQQEPMTRSSDEKRRTTVYIDRVGSVGAVCTVAGVNLPPGSAYVPHFMFPVEMWPEAEPGKVFFAYANLNAESEHHVGVERIEREWGVTDGPLHWEAESA